MIRTIAAAAVLTLAVSVMPAHAADDQNAVNVPSATPAPAAKADNLIWGEHLTGGALKVTRSTSRPIVLPVLYASYAALQAYDVYSTRQGLARGAREANPLMKGVAGQHQRHGGDEGRRRRGDHHGGRAPLEDQQDGGDCRHAGVDRCHRSRGGA